MKLEILYNNTTVQTKDGGAVIAGNVPKWQLLYWQEIVHRVNLHEELIEAAKNLANVAEKETADLIAWDGAWPLDAAIDKLRAIIEKAANKTQGESQKH